MSMRTGRLAALWMALILACSVLPAQADGNADAEDYARADALLREGRYEEACSLFSQIAGYEDAAQKAYALNVVLRLDCEALTDTALLCSYDGLYGLVELGSGTVLSPRWSEARLLGPETLAARGEDGWAVLTLRGEDLSGERWDAVTALDDAVLLVSRDGLYGLADMTGAALLRPVWTGAAGCTDGTLPETLTLGEDGLIPVRDADGLWGYADRSGAYVIEPCYAWAGSFDVNGQAVVQRADGSYAVIDAQASAIPAEGAEAWNAARQADYDEAAALLDEGRYPEAIEGFSALVPYADTEDRVKESYYRLGLWLREQGMTEEARDAFDLAAEWPGAEDQITELDYEEAEALEAAGDLTEALDLYLRLGDYRNSAARADALEKQVVGLETVFFGRYEQDGDTENGKEPIEWYVLRRGKTGVTLLSRYCLDQQVYKDLYKGTSWEKCELREWLNDTFLRTAFTKAERKAIMLRKVKNDADQANPIWETEGSEDTEDRVYLLSYHEVDSGLTERAARRARPTAYALSRGVETFDGWCRWWTRSRGNHVYNVNVVDEEGTLDTYAETMVTFMGVRPAITVDPDLLAKYGTAEPPAAAEEPEAVEEEPDAPEEETEEPEEQPEAPAEEDDEDDVIIFLDEDEE